LESPEKSGKVDIAGEKEGAEDDPAGSSKDAGSDLRGWHGCDSAQDTAPHEDAESRSSGFDPSKHTDFHEDGDSQTRAVCGGCSGSDDMNAMDILSKELSAELFGPEPEVETPSNAQAEELASPEHAPTTAPHEAVTDAMTSQEDKDKETGSPEAEVDHAAEERRAQKLQLLEEIVGLRRAIASRTLDLEKVAHPILRQRFSNTLDSFREILEGKRAELARLDLEG
jgi:TATA-binding protein-associated factor Taf7